jgi:CRISPR-associated endonuclease/helicase Cas3
VFEDAKQDDWTDAGKLNNYLESFKRFDFYHINSEFQLIENNDTQSIFIPVDIAIPDEYNPEMLDKIGALNESGDKISGERLFDIYISLIKNKNTDFIQKQIELKKLSGLMAQFTLSVYPAILKEIHDKCDAEKADMDMNIYHIGKNAIMLKLVLTLKRQSKVFFVTNLYMRPQYILKYIIN